MGTTRVGAAGAEAAAHDLDQLAQTMDAEHLGLERERARLLDTLGPVATHEAEEREDLPHPRPGQRTVEQPLGEEPDVRAVLSGLALEETTVAQRTGGLLGRKVARVGVPLVRRDTRVHLHELAAVVETHRLAIGAGFEPVAPIDPRQRVERLEHRGVLPAIACVKANDLDRAHQLAVKAVEDLRAAGARVVVLACTETPLAVEHAPCSSAAYCIDATRALARACVVWHRAASAQAKHL